MSKRKKKEYTVEKRETVKVEYVVVVHTEQGIKEDVAKCFYKDYATQIRTHMAAFEEIKNG